MTPITLFKINDRGVCGSRLTDNYIEWRQKLACETAPLLQIV